MTTGSPLVSLFKEQLEAECKAINGRVGLTGRGDALVWWYFTKLHGFTDQEVAEIFCDGGG
ncbi:MAG: hypothetical protein NT013_12755, partial [Planctomycetia bacterium]|nr:hypothetical protein [Planctomycetia bacterium]